MIRNNVPVLKGWVLVTLSIEEFQGYVKCDDFWKFWIENWKLKRLTSGSSSSSWWDDTRCHVLDPTPLPPVCGDSSCYDQEGRPVRTRTVGRSACKWTQSARGRVGRLDGVWWNGWTGHLGCTGQTCSRGRFWAHRIPYSRNLHKEQCLQTLTARKQNEIEG